MTFFQKLLGGSFGLFLAVWGVTTIIWAITYGYATYRLDQCSQVRTVSTAVLQADVARLRDGVDIKKHPFEPVPR